MRRIYTSMTFYAFRDFTRYGIIELIRKQEVNNEQRKSNRWDFFHENVSHPFSRGG